MEESIRKADILIEALPYIQSFRGKVIVAKYGGSAIDNAGAMRGILQDLVFLSVVGIHPVLVHGGGAAISRRLSSTGASSSFIDGMRVTDEQTILVVKEALDEVNSALVDQLEALGGHAVGVTARDKVVLAEPHAKATQLGFVGSVKTVQTSLLNRLFSRQAIPVISPIGVGDGRLYNINADEVACEVAARLRAEKLVLLTNVRGILREPGDAGSLISTLSMKEAKVLLERQVIHGGMIPKVQSCMAALRHGVKKAHIIDAAVPRALLLEIFTKQGVGTEIVH